jgi:hypothetical protein
MQLLRSASFARRIHLRRVILAGSGRILESKPLPRVRVRPNGGSQRHARSSGSGSGDGSGGVSACGGASGVEARAAEVEVVAAAAVVAAAQAVLPRARQSAAARQRIGKPRAVRAQRQRGRASPQPSQVLGISCGVRSTPASARPGGAQAACGVRQSGPNELFRSVCCLRAAAPSVTAVRRNCTVLAGALRAPAAAPRRRALPAGCSVGTRQRVHAAAHGNSCCQHAPHPTRARARCPARSASART